MTAPCAPEREAAGAWHLRVWALAGPIIVSNLSTPLLGAVDTAVVGHLPDPAYIGGVAVGAVVFNFLYWGFGFLRMGTTGFTAQAFGAGEAEELRASLARPLLLALALGAPLVVVQAPVGWTAFWLFEASDRVEGFARSYYAIRIWSAPAALANYAMLGWLLGTRRAGAVLLLQVVLNGINIVLDLVFVLGLGWGVEGVALASLLAEFGAMGLGLAIVARALKSHGGAWDWARIGSRGHLVVLLRANLDIFVRTLCLLGAFAYFTAQSAKMGDVLLAGNAILLQLQNFTAYGLDGFAHAVEVLAGNALGARSRKAFREAVRVSTLWALGTASLVSGLYLVLGGSVVGLFTDLAAVRAAAETYLPWVVVAPVVSVWSFQLDGIFIGTTRTAEMRNAMLLSLFVYLGACWILVPTLGNHGLWLAFTVLMVARAASLGLLYPRLERLVASKG
ncbi:MAG: MATE family efflux transporter [Rhodospirillales bacterium]|nr:MATE family efflux transporter [Rhodospirillales bacterium]